MIHRFSWFFQQIVVEEAIIYIEALQKQLLTNLGTQEGLELENRQHNAGADAAPVGPLQPDGADKSKHSCEH